MSYEDEESAPRPPSGADKGKKSKKKSTSHNHIGPNLRAFRVGVAFCPVCDAEKILRPTEKELVAQRAAKDAERASKSAKTTTRTTRR